MREAARAARITIEVGVELTPRQIAAAFAELSDDGQAQVIIELAELAKAWDAGTIDQWYAVGRHLRTCSCGTEEARELVLRIAAGIRWGGGSDG